MNLKLINFIQEDLKLRHNKRSNKITITINGTDKSAKTVDEIVSIIDGSKSIYKNNTNWIEFKSNCESELKDNENFYEVLPDILKEHVTYILTNKTNAANKIHSDIEASAFNSFVKELAELPKVGFSTVDKIILKRIRYCKDDASIYLKKNGQLKLIGKLELLKRDPTQAGICKLIKEEIGNQWNNGSPMKIDEYVSFCLHTITKLRHYLITETKKQIDAGAEFNDIEIDVEGEVFSPAKRSYADDANALENAVHNYCIERLWETVPCSLFTSRVIVLKAMFNTYEIVRNDGTSLKVNEFVKYTYDVVRSGEALTEATYLKNILNVYAAELKDDEDFKLKNVPRTYADADVDTLFRYDETTFKKNYKDIDFYTKLEDCYNIMQLKSWMNEDEFRFAMAWAYAAVHPITVKSNIAILIWTGGGTGKSSFVSMIKHAIRLATNASEDEFFFLIKGEKFIQDDKNWMPDGQIGLPKAALINIDEATTECIERYKDFSGSADGNILTLRLNYENALNYDVKGKFIFTTNKGLQLTSNDGSLERRVAIIKNTSKANSCKNDGKTDAEIREDFIKQIPMMLQLGKKAVEDILAMGYSTIDAYAINCPNINKNIQESTAMTINSEIYSQIWDILKERFPNCKQQEGDYRMQGRVLKMLYDEVCLNNGEDNRFFSTFKKFIMDKSDKFENDNEKNQFRNFLRYDDDTEKVEICTKSVGCIYSLFPLKK